MKKGTLKRYYHLRQLDDIPEQKGFFELKTDLSFGVRIAYTGGHQLTIWETIKDGKRLITFEIKRLDHIDTSIDILKLISSAIKTLEETVWKS